jgi:hypothetical protein
VTSKSIAFLSEVFLQELLGIEIKVYLESQAPEPRNADLQAQFLTEGFRHTRNQL